jgi:hypothetical protein
MGEQLLVSYFGEPFIAFKRRAPAYVPFLR